MKLTELLLGSSLPLALASALPRSTVDGHVYAYGLKDRGGLPVVNIGGHAYVTTRRQSTIHPVNFTLADGQLVASTNDRDLLIAVPTGGGIVSFVDKSKVTDLTTNGFGYFGHMLYLSINGNIETLWTAKATTDPDIFQLGWNLTDSNLPLNLRDIAPATRSSRGAV